MTERPRSRLMRALVPGVLIAGAVIVSILAANLVFREVLVRSALNREADHFAARYVGNRDASLPDTAHLFGVLAEPGDRNLPQQLRQLQAGLHGEDVYGEERRVHVSELPDGRRLFLIYDESGVENLSLFFGVIPLMAVLIVLYGVFWFLHRVSRRYVSPVMQLANRVREHDPSAGPLKLGFDTSGSVIDADVHVLAEALEAYSGRIGDFVERERNFTRDASHELRSPLTVIRMATDTLQKNADLKPAQQNNLARIRRSAEDMEELISVFLMLARENDRGLTRETCRVLEIAREEVERRRHLLDGRDVRVEWAGSDEVTVDAPRPVLATVVGNLISNAFQYTDVGKVVLSTGGGALVLEDTGGGIAAEDLGRVFEPHFRGRQSRRSGYGLGLDVVKRLADRFGWGIRLQSEPGKGTRVTLTFA